MICGGGGGGAEEGRLFNIVFVQHVATLLALVFSDGLVIRLVDAPTCVFQFRMCSRQLLHKGYQLIPFAKAKGYTLFCCLFFYAVRGEPELANRNAGELAPTSYVPPTTKSEKRLRSTPSELVLNRVDAQTQFFPSSCSYKSALISGK